MTRTRWVIFGVICLVVLGALVFFSSKDNIDVSNIDGTKIVTQGPIADHIVGPKKAKVLLIEYGDFACPGCGSLHPSLKPLVDNYKDQLTFVFRHFPLTTIHPNALAAATAAEAAGLQGKFFEMHDKLYESQSSWTSASPEDRTAIFRKYAGEIELDVNKFEKDLTSKNITTKIRRDQALGEKAKVTGTPSLFLNGKALSNNDWKTSDALEKKLRQAIKASDQELPKPVNNFSED